jgi:hypothetical protein
MNCYSATGETRSIEKVAGRMRNNAVCEDMYTESYEQKYALLVKKLQKIL